VTDELQSPAGAVPAAGEHHGTLWRNHDFVKLWSGEALSQLATQITLVVIPLTAVITLDAGADVVGLLAATQYAPILLASLFAGVWLDRHRRRPVLVAAYLARAVVLAVIPVLYLLGLLTLTPLFLVAFAAGLASAVSDVAYISYLPQLVPRRHIVRANARIEASYSVAEISGPALGGALAQALSAPLALVGAVVGNLLAGMLGLRIRHAESVPLPSPERERPWSAIRKGIRATLVHPVFRPLVLQAAAFNLFASVVLVLFLLYGVRELGLSAATLGFLLSAGSVGGLVGTLVAARIADRLGVGRTLVWSMVVASVPLGLVPATGAPGGATTVAVLVAGLWWHGMGTAVFNVLALSTRALLSPPDMLGRITATFRFMSTGTLPLGGLLAGALGVAVGTRTAMAISVGALAVCCAVFATTRVRTFRISDEPASGTVP
jgi:MFS family permease